MRRVRNDHWNDPFIAEEIDGEGKDESRAQYTNGSSCNSEPTVSNIPMNGSNVYQQWQSQGSSSEIEARTNSVARGDASRPSIDMD